MKMLTVSVFVCAMMALTRATPLPETEDQPVTQDIMVDHGDSWTPFTTAETGYTDGDSWTPITTPETGYTDGDSWTPITTPETALPETEDQPVTQDIMVDRYTDGDSWTPIKTPETALPETEDQPVTQDIMVDRYTDGDSWTPIKTPETALPETEDQPVTQDIMVDRYTDGDSWTPITTPETDEAWFPSCPDGWTTFSIRCLRYVAESMTWDEAQENCRSMQGNLAFLGNAESFDDVHKLIQSAGDNSGNVWVGGCDSEDLSWSWSIFDWTSDKREHFCFQPSGENVSGCLNETQCESHLPSVCSVILI